MGFMHWLGGLFDRGGQQRADQANADLTSTLSANSPYWQASQLTGDDDILKGAAQLQNANIGVDTSAVDADSEALQGLQGQFADIAKNGGKATQAQVHQAQADLANTRIGQLKTQDKASVGNVIDTDTNERAFGNQGATQTRAQILANALKKQAWNTAVSHANFEASMAGQGIMNTDQNLAGALALSMGEGANAARAGQRGTQMQQNATTFQNAMQTAQLIGSALSQTAGGIAGMSGAASDAQAATSAGDSGSGQMSYSGGTGDSAGYAMPSAAITSPSMSSKMVTPQDTTPETYTNPISGSTVNANYPSDTSAWASWLTDGSSLVS